ncbi:hypothetical protein BDV33DRAFT_210572, partial [Aspergillus novoparasiticus]
MGTFETQIAVQSSRPSEVLYPQLQQRGFAKMKVLLSYTKWAFIFLQEVGSAQPWRVQINTTICNWDQFRAGIMRETIRVQGGNRWSIPGFIDGSYGIPENDGNSAGTLFAFSLAESFDTTTTNTTGLFSRGPQDPFVPVINYESGTMFVTDNEFMLFGGVARLTDDTNRPGRHDVLGYERYQWGPYRESWRPGFVDRELPSNMTAYITHGAGVSVPSESLGFYFGGMQAPGGGLISSDDGSANMSAPTLIGVDLSKMRDEEWTNMSLPNDITTRANAQVVWLPVSAQGALVVIGGVPHPESLYPAGLSDAQAEQNIAAGPSFMTTVTLYDIARKRWYRQNTTGEAPRRPQALSCAVVASAPDGSSHNIYVYGGYDGTDPEQAPYDDVYILSIPSFTWFKAYTGQTRHGRSGHQCIK